MARSFNGDTPDYLYTNSPPVTGAPFTISVRANVTYLPTGVNKVILSLSDTASDNNGFIIYVGADSLSYFFIQDSVGYTQTAGVANTYGQWQNYCAVEAAVDDHALYYNGAKYTSVVSRIPASIDRFSIGIRGDQTPDMPLYGSAAEAAIWNTALTADEASVLSKGYSPLLIRPQNLVFYIPLIRDNDDDLIGGLALTASGSPGITAHPRIFYLSPLPIRYETSVAPPAGAIMNQLQFGNLGADLYNGTLIG